MDSRKDRCVGKISKQVWSSVTDKGKVYRRMEETEGLDALKGIGMKGR